MANAKHVDIAEAVKDSINSSTTLDVIAQRKYPGAVDLNKIAGQPEVFVFPVGHSWEYINREQTSWHLYDVQVVVRAALTVEGDEYDQEQIDALLLLLQDIGDRLRDAGQMSAATLVAGTNEPIFEPERLDEHLFYAGLTFSYRIGRTT